jgi:hypothetical protein
MIACRPLPAALLLFAAAPASSSVQEAGPPGIVLRQVVPRPTGRNGYEEFILAGELAASDKVFVAAEVKGPEATLTEQRVVLKRPTIIRALATFRRGLAKPAFRPNPPRTFLEAGDPGPNPYFRTLARLLRMEQYVLLADGDTAAALVNLRDGLRFSLAIGTEGLLDYLNGSAVQSLVLDPVARHLEQLSAADCDHLLRICRDWMSAPSALPGVVATERRLALSFIDHLRQNPQELRTFLAEDEEFKDLLPQFDGVTRDGPAAMNRLFDEAARRTDDYTGRLTAELKRPAWEWQLPAIDRGKTVAERLAWYELQGLQFGLQVPGRRPIADAHLLACHAAILRYRWEHDRLPASLADLHLGDLAIDPFSGHSLLYEVTGRHYRLSSIGWKDLQTGERKPYLLPREQARAAAAHANHQPP